MPKIVLKKQNWFFEGKEDEEDVVLVLHRHWFTLSMKIFLVIVFTVLPFVALVVFSSIIVKYSLISMFSFAWITYYLLLWYWLFYTITMYTLDNWIVTTKRIIDSLQNGFFNRRVSELHLEKIQDVSYRITGLLPTFFNYGVVEIQTAGKEQKFLFEDVPNPQRIKDIIMELILEEEEEDENGGLRNHTTQGSQNHILVEKDGVPSPIVTVGSEDVVSPI
ncbi:MAG: PH domain-containing protein [bacterium]